MPERKKVRAGIFYLIKILHQPSSGKNTRNNLLLTYAGIGRHIINT